MKEKVRKRKLDCQDLKRFPSTYADHVNSLRAFASGYDDETVDRNILGSFLKILQKTDGDCYAIENISIISVMHIWSNMNLNSRVKVMTGNKVKFHVENTSVNQKLTFTVSCLENKLSWPLAIDLKITFLAGTDDQKSKSRVSTSVIECENFNQVTRVYCDWIFIDSSTQHKCAFNHSNSFISMQGNYYFVFEIDVHEKKN